MQTRIFRNITMVIIALMSFLLSFTSCKKLLEIEPPITSVNQANLFSNDATAISVLTGMYISMSSNGYFTGNLSISFLAGLSADEFTLHSNVSNNVYPAFYKNVLAAKTTADVGSQFWEPLYAYVFRCNAAIEGLNEATELTPLVKQQLLGEAKYLRAFFYFYLVNFFGDVPLVLTTDVKTNSTVARTPKDQVYQQIIIDLKDAQQLLSSNYVNINLVPYGIGSAERTRPNKSSATALLARVYLFNADYASAEQEATNIISNSSTYSLTSLNNAFLKNSTESIWQLQPVTSGHNTEDAWLFVINAAPGNSKPIYLNQSLLSGFEVGDNRRTNWVKDTTIGSSVYPYPFKYKSATNGAPLNEYLTVLRLSEQYLIRAEARTRLNNIAGAQADLNIIRNRAGLANTTAANQTSLLAAILKERQIELFSEWGHRWLDLKRTATIDAVMSVVTPLKANAPWQSYQQLYPLPLVDIQRNLSLIQNLGY